MKKRMKVTDLTGSALDYAVDRAANGNKYSEQLSLIRTSGDAFHPSSSWRVCGPLMERHSVSCYQSMDPETAKVIHWVAVYELVEPRKRRGWIAENPLTAICRAIAAMAGDEIDIPFELIKSKGDAK
jgi:hypothetical protein